MNVRAAGRATKLGGLGTKLPINEKRGPFDLGRLAHSNSTTQLTDCCATDVEQPLSLFIRLVCKLGAQNVSRSRCASRDRNICKVCEMLQKGPTQLVVGACSTAAYLRISILEFQIS